MDYLYFMDKQAEEKVHFTSARAAELKTGAKKGRKDDSRHISETCGTTKSSPWTLCVYVRALDSFLLMLNEGVICISN